MKAYVFDDIPGDQRLPHDSGNPISLNTLSDLGVIYKQIPIGDDKKWEDEINSFAKERGYKNRDQITVTREGLGAAYEDKIKSFFDEHLHEDEEIRYILGGSGYFDVRGVTEPYNERWIRISLEKGDLIVLPAGIYHRFTVDSNNTITAMRLFQDEPKWTPHSRSAPDTDEREARGEYLQQVKGAIKA
ncbi:1,2-dihydroxy-3-keto-5-methylthiopentene dioxygenase [Kwoniella dejecticola CBS 10117]|uniref:Acireductone dioxygenase n=1 Tax=Kwoniella dejecticola CBS 10117 TaxID=1296121 RepID=A0A1A6AEJ3_9TREE|nr:1,2-dihydroxy-3-keto-5-methylthiopentene dioxygenase [Kwoniella dejecticola CBS 10117]OBR88491.1 1,2-dihydroxy-3-keto-5-methylthiopentene dioxygenase [Kwoniella dejecticola CBS 10117]